MTTQRIGIRRVLGLTFSNLFHLGPWIAAAFALLYAPFLLADRALASLIPNDDFSYGLSYREIFWYVVPLGSIGAGWCKALIAIMVMARMNHVPLKLNGIVRHLKLSLLSVTVISLILFLVDLILVGISSATWSFLNEPLRLAIFLIPVFYVEASFAAAIPIAVMENVRV
jgi:hypothetical protein